MSQQELVLLRQRLLTAEQENTFLRIALARSIGDGMLILEDKLSDSPRFSVETSACGLKITVAEPKNNADVL